MENKNDLTGVKVGDRLWSSNYGWGEVSSLGKDTSFPVAIVFPKIYTHYTYKGIHSLNDLSPTLFWDEIKFEYPKKPLPDLAVDTKVWVWLCENKKEKRHFSHFYKNGNISCFNHGATSWSSKKTDVTMWTNYELYEETN